MQIRSQKLKNSFTDLFTAKRVKPQTMEELQSQTMNWLRFPLALLVLFIHINPQTRDTFTPIHTIDVFHLTLENIYSVIGRMGTYLGVAAVPFFFFTSGYFFFYKLESWNLSVYKVKISKRLRTLLVPYI